MSRFLRGPERGSGCVAAVPMDTRQTALKAKPLD